MFRALLFLSAISAGFVSSDAEAATRIGEETRSEKERGAPSGVLLAQSGDVEVYFDGAGNRVLVDSYTGEIISVQPRGRFNNQAERREIRRQELGRPEPREQDRYYLDDLADMERLRRDRQQGVVRGGPPAPGDYGYYDDYLSEPPPDDVLRGEPSRNLPNPNYNNPNYQDPNYRDPTYTARENPSGSALPQPVERAPLGEPAPLGTPPASQQPPSDTLRNPSVAPTMALSAREKVAALQILLDRAGASPGVIDGRFGSNVDKAIIAYREITGKNLRSTDEALIEQGLAETGGDPFMNYEITPTDAAGPFVASIPSDYGEKAQLEHMSYTSVVEMLGERFHMDESYLRALNPEANFNRPGTIIRVANIKRTKKPPVKRIVADKANKQVRAYDENGKLVLIYPSTIGSSDTPSPSGVHAVTRVALNPNYTYNPKLNFKQGNNEKILTIPPGPNGPVGSVWIALDKPTYGIHGTPDPSKIGKTESHGCVRLTNWDAQELAKLVSPGVMVEFLD